MAPEARPFLPPIAPRPPPSPAQPLRRPSSWLHAGEELATLQAALQRMGLGGGHAAGSLPPVTQPTPGGPAAEAAPSTLHSALTPALPLLGTGGPGPLVFRLTAVQPDLADGKKEESSAEEVVRVDPRLFATLQKQVDALKQTASALTDPLSPEPPWPRKEQRKARPSRGPDALRSKLRMLTRLAPRCAAAGQGHQTNPRRLARAVAERIRQLRCCSAEELLEFQERCDAWQHEKERRTREERGVCIARNREPERLRGFLPELRQEAVTRQLAAARERERQVRAAAERVRESADRSRRQRATERRRNAANCETLPMMQAHRRACGERWAPVLAALARVRAFGRALDKHRGSSEIRVRIRQTAAVAVLEDWWIGLRRVQQGAAAMHKIRMRCLILRNTGGWVRDAKTRELMNKHNLVAQFLRDIASTRRFAIATRRFLSRVRRVQAVFRDYARAKRAQLVLWGLQWSAVESAMRSAHQAVVSKAMQRLDLPSPALSPLATPSAAPSGNPTLKNSLARRSSLARRASQSPAVSATTPEAAAQQRLRNTPISLYKRLVGQPLIPDDVRKQVLERELRLARRKWARRTLRWQQQMRYYERELRDWQQKQIHLATAAPEMAEEMLQNSAGPPAAPPRPRLPLLLPADELPGLIERTCKTVAADIAARVARRLSAEPQKQTAPEGQQIPATPAQPAHSSPHGA
eukprot:TRINITY_DN13553_c0_g1_i1.p1 TRINITY_DN13553_c0_g1~~TRINITY_DN13553_c0_g1_i1.p1  ORF type:complete len:697 (+),score=206.90 TRINITY_DN13553_c0_g1_i1:90-2180(+)